MAQVHPTAIVERGAQLADDVEVGPYAVIGSKVQIGAGTRIGAHAVVQGRTRIGANNRIFAFCAIGGEPQDKKYRGEDTELLIGDGNTIREYCTFNTGTVQGGGITRVGSQNWIMAYVHVAHDVLIGDHVILANSVQLAGHVSVGDWAILGGITGVHQFVRIGAHAMTGAGTTLLQDLPPYVICNGNPAQPHGINVEGLKRRGFAPDCIRALRRAYKTVYKEGRTVADACGEIDALASAAPGCAQHLQLLRDFLRSSERGVIR
jgi:UDP-N-acetylglucosamine acyltransferase